MFGDYDVDGACSAALMQRFLAAHGRKARIYIPDRMTEGLRPERGGHRGARRARAPGSSSPSTAAPPASTRSPPPRPLGAEVVVVDHHQADERLPEVAAVINPNRQDDLSGLGHLCAAGVTFMLLVATARELRRRGYYGARAHAAGPARLLDLVALATVCDVVPLKGLNRAYVTKGLQVMRQRRNIGLRALADAAGLAVPPTPYHLGFVLGPRINAGGRIGDAALGARLLATDDEIEAARIAELLDKLNRERKAHRGRACWRRRSPAPRRMLEADPDLPAAAGRRRGLAQGRGRPRRQPAHRPLPAARLRHRLERAPARAPARCARSPASTSARPCAPPWRQGISPRAAATPWRRA